MGGVAQKRIVTVMQKVLSSDLWKVVEAQARKARLRKVAIPYVTQDLLGFCEGDLLLVDASRLAISSGETDDRLLRALRRKGVRLYHCQSLRAIEQLIPQSSELMAEDIDALC